MAEDVYKVFVLVLGENLSSAEMRKRSTIIRVEKKNREMAVKG